MTAHKKRVNQVGRPAEVDRKGQPIEKKVININVPVNMVNFLKDYNINRSKLFTKIVCELYDQKICPKCFTYNIRDVPVGIQCNNCEAWLKMKPCPNCKESYDPYFNMFKYDEKTKTKGCQRCLKG